MNVTQSKCFDEVSFISECEDNTGPDQSACIVSESTG